MIAHYRPRNIGPAPAAFAREVVAAVAPARVARAKALLYAAGRAGAFGASMGLELEAGLIFSTPVIERFIISLDGSVSGPTRRTLASNLRALSHLWGGTPRPASLSREAAKAPYSPAQISAYLALAESQPTPDRRCRAVGLIALGAGAGLTGVDLRGARGTDIVARSGGMVVSVRARRARVVPVLRDYHTRLGEVGAYFGPRYVVGGLEPTRRNITTGLISSLCGGADLPRLEIPRLRSTWLATLAGAIGLRAFMDAAGIVCSQRLGDVVGGLDPVSEEAAVSLLSGRAG